MFREDDADEAAPAAWWCRAAAASCDEAGDVVEPDAGCCCCCEDGGAADLEPEDWLFPMAGEVRRRRSRRPNERRPDEKATMPGFDEEEGAGRRGGLRGTEKDARRLLRLDLDGAVLYSKSRGDSYAAWMAMGRWRRAEVTIKRSQRQWVGWRDRSVSREMLLQSGQRQALVVESPAGWRVYWWWGGAQRA